VLEESWGTVCYHAIDTNIQFLLWKKDFLGLFGFFFCIIFPPLENEQVAQWYPWGLCGLRMRADSWSEATRKWSDRGFSRMLIVMSVKPTLTDEQLKVNSAFKPILSVIEDQCSEEDSISKQAQVKLVNKQPRDFWFQVLRCFRVVWSQFWTSSNCLLVLETTTNNQEVKRSLYRLENVNNLRKDYIRMCLTCRSLAELFNFIGLVELQECIYSIL